MSACPTCGIQLRDGAKFCAGCGRPTPSAAALAEIAAARSAAAGTPSPSVLTESTPTAAAPVPARESRNRLVVPAAILAVAIAVTGYLVFSHGRTTTSETTAKTVTSSDIKPTTTKPATTTTTALIAKSATAKPATTAAAAATSALTTAAPATTATTASGSGLSPAKATPVARALSPNAVAAIDGCVSPDATDASGNVVTYGAENAVDGRADTAWRCPGSPGGGGRYGLSVTFTRPVSLRRVAAIPGYAKFDNRYPTLDRFVQNNRVAIATWTCLDDAGKSSAVQERFDQSRASQPIDVTWERCTTVSLEITAVYPGVVQNLPDPPGTQEAKDETPVSELEFVGWESA
jgi:hypothetical protein